MKHRPIVARVGRALGAAAVSVGLLFGGIGAARADAPTTLNNILCPNAGILNELVGGVCWSAIFPIMIAGHAFSGFGFGTSQVPNGAYTGSPLCTCGGSLKNAELPRIGFPIGYWQPSLIVEATAAPFCMPALGGAYAGGTSTSGNLFSGALGGNVNNGREGEHKGGFYNVHQYTFPLVVMMNILNIPNCGTGYNGWNLVGLSEVEPQWNDDLTAALIWPESALLAGPIGFLGAVGECAAQIPPGGQPIQSMYWTAGCWGLLFPATGNLQENDSPVRGSSADVSRFMSTQYRLGFGYRTIGNSTICRAKTTVALPKNQFRMQMVYPNNETGNVPNSKPDPNGGGPQPLEDNIEQPGMTGDHVRTILSPAQTNAAMDSIVNKKACTHWIGQPTLSWGEWLDQPGAGGNFVYLVWQWTDCCMGVIGGSLTQ
jgi:conjugal transfer pilus assembly protein TraU